MSTQAPSLGRGCRVQRGGVGFLFRRRSRLLFAFPIEEGFAGETVFPFLHPPHAKTAVSYERPFLCVLLAKFFQAVDGKSCIDGTAIRKGVFVDVEGRVMVDAVDAFVPISGT